MHAVPRIIKLVPGDVADMILFDKDETLEHLISMRMYLARSASKARVCKTYHVFDHSGLGHGPGSETWSRRCGPHDMI